VLQYSQLMAEGYMMIATGYHGTRRVNADQILTSQEFHPSDSGADWLGNGIYFYESYEDALYWKKNSEEICTEAILHVIVQYGDHEFLDLDQPEGQHVYEELEQSLAQSGYEPEGDISQRTCAVVKLLWQQCDQVKVMFCSFPRQPRPIRTLIEYRKKRREICVKNNESIKNIIEVGRVI